jgi:hypothetical protein
MTTLAEKIRRHEGDIKEAMYIGCANWEQLVKRIEGQEQMKDPDFHDEQVWTFVVGCGYAVQGEKGTGKLAGLLIEGEPPSPTKAWFEVLPEPPRSREGESHIDLAVGTIAQRGGAEKSGIALSSDKDSWVCFVECKWYSDIAHSVSYDQHRNQLARVADNALYFRQEDCDQFAQQVHVTLVTPEVFRSCSVRSRLYQYKYEEYKANLSNLKRDLEESCLRYRRRFPPIEERLPCLRLHWITYDTLFLNLPDSELKQPLLDFFEMGRRACIEKA